MSHNVKTGLENLVRSPIDIPDTARIGLLANPASLDRNFVHASVWLDRCYPNQLTALFSPQHGFYGEKQDNMIESDHIEHPVFKIPVFSLYSETRKPTQNMFDLIDILFIDLQDVGTRVYTFIYTISYCLEMAASMNKRVIILDRPNPLGGVVTEGNVLDPEWSSFVGRFPVPMRHGLTVAEISTYFNEQFNIRCALEVIPMAGWKRNFYFHDTGLPWTAPSPNLPTVTSSYVYPGQVIYEGTQVSEGRGTTMPFEQFGAPYINPEPIIEQLTPHLEGVVLRQVCFQPTSGKFSDQMCRGLFIHITDMDAYRPYLLSLRSLQAIICQHNDRFEFKAPPYEYEFDRLPMDLILGSKELREQLQQMVSIDELKKSWEPGLQAYNRKIESVFIYE
ncbi:MAG: DUF1343 domain-containing protein [Desulfobacteraceae bacterium]|nr:MAG: DUF1343 domain-containing protein [Desulfobacteraceae bacterium]